MSVNRNLEMQRITNHKKEEYKYFVGTTVKDALSYNIGEKMIFKIRAKYMDDYLDIPYIQYSLISDDGQKEEGFINKSEDGWFYIEASISKSGFVYVQAKACDDNKQVIEDIAVFNGSAGADIKNILRATKTPEDYHEFWDKLKKDVEATELEVLFCEKVENDEFPDYEIYDMRIKASGSDYVSLMVTYPKDAKEGSLKFAMYFTGYGVYTVNPRPMEGYLTVSVNSHAIPNRQNPEFYTDLRENKYARYGFSEEENKKPETTYWCQMNSRNLQAMRYFKDHRLINKKDYVFAGSSQGGMQACNLAAHFERASAVILNVPWLSDIDAEKLMGRRPTSMPKGYGVTYFDTAVAAQFVKCPVYIISGLGDPTCNSSTQMALFNSIKSPKYIEFYQNKVHSFTIPWDDCKYPLGDLSMADKYKEHTSGYYKYN